MNESELSLKKPILLKILAILFIFAPLGNVVLSILIQGRFEAFEPTQFINLVMEIPAADLIWLGLLSFTGLLLYVQHKTSWALAVITLFITLGMNFYHYLDLDSAPDSSAIVLTQIFFSVFATLTVLMVIFYARYPYLDRRRGWLFPAVRRVRAQTPVKIMAQDIFEGITESISIRGCRIHLQRDLGAIAKMKFVDIIFPEIRNIKLKARIVEYSDNVLRLRFKDLGPNENKILSKWLQKKT